MKKLEFSKLILYVLYITAVVFSLLTVYVALKGADAGSIANIVLAMWASVSSGVVFYYWKAKAENLIKLERKMPGISDKLDND